MNDIALITRVKSLVRLKTLTDELMMRASTSNEIGLDETFDPMSLGGDGGKVLLVDDSPATADRVKSILSPHHTVDLEPEPQEALFRAAEGDYDLAIVSLNLKQIDGLRLCSHLRSLDRTRLLPILVIVDPEDNVRLLRGLDLGVNDYLVRPIDRNEMLARVRTQVRRKRFSDRLRDNVQMTIEMAVTDGLTGLHNRRYLERHLATLVNQAIAREKPLSVLVLDIDHFKAINDGYGHAVGDDVLREFSRRVRKAVRGIDLACRMGGGGIRHCHAGYRCRPGVAGRRAPAPKDCRRTIPYSGKRRKHRGDRFGRHLVPRLDRGYPGNAPQARRRGALRGQAGGAKPGLRRRLTRRFGGSRPDSP